MFLHRKLLPKTIINPSGRAFPCFSSSSIRTPSEPDPASVSDPPPPDRAAAGGSTPSPDPSHSYFRDIKERLSSPSPPRRIPSDPPPPPAFTVASKPTPAASLEEIRKHLFEFKLKSGGSISGDHPPSRSAVSPGNSGPGIGATGPDGGREFQSIRESLKKFRGLPRDNEGTVRSSGFNIKAFQDGLKQEFGPGRKVPQLIGTDNLPESIFGKERKEKKEEGKESMPKVRTTEFVKTYSYEELGQKLQKLRPEKDGNKAYCFTLSELNERLAKLRELEEKEIESRAGGLIFKDLRESLIRLKDVEAKKKANSGFPIIGNLGLLATPAFMLNPPQEHLLENYFHPDHMSSSEKLKLELNKVRDEFKMSENDCGSTRVQVAQLTTKIKHLSSTLHKKDKHSRKGLHDMVQMRKKLLKYLRRTDWDSYCLVLSKLGLRDVPDYKIPNYAT